MTDRPDIVESPPRRHVSPLVAVAVGLVVVALVAGLADRWLRVRELEALITRIEASEQTIDDAVRRRDDIIADLIGADLSGIEPGDVESSARERRALAARTARALGGVAAEMDRLSVLGWHDDVALARDQYVDRVLAWQGYWRSGLTDPRQLRAGQPEPAVGPSPAEVAESLSAALPVLPSDDLVARVAELAARSQ